MVSTLSLHLRNGSSILSRGIYTMNLHLFKVKHGQVITHHIVNATKYPDREQAGLRLLKAIGKGGNIEIAYIELITIDSSLETKEIGYASTHHRY